MTHLCVWILSGSPLNRCTEEDKNKTVVATEATMKVGRLELRRNVYPIVSIIRKLFHW